MSTVRRGTAGTDQDRQSILVRAAWLYYKDRLTQAAIAERYMFYSYGDAMLIL